VNSDHSLGCSLGGSSDPLLAPPLPHPHPHPHPFGMGMGMGMGKGRGREGVSVEPASGLSRVFLAYA
jgi:hypothetical protein